MTANVLIHSPDAGSFQFSGIDRRLEIWISLEEGLRAADLFADIETAMNKKFGEGTELIARVRRAKSEFVCLPSIEDNTDTSAV